MLIRLFFLNLILMNFGGFAQELQLKTEINGDFDLMMTNHIGQLYLTKGNELFLYSQDGKLLFQYSSLSSGEVAAVDTRNPMKLLLFYPDFGQITFLDNTLSRTGESVLRLEQLNLELAQLACTSFDNGVWIYDPISFSLIRFNQSFQITNEVSNVNQLVGLELNPIQMVEAENWLYLNDPAHGVFVFDSFGTFSKRIAIEGVSHFQVRGNGIFLQTEEGLIKFETLSLNQKNIELPTDKFRSVRIENKYLYLLTKHGVLIYGANQNSK